MRILITGGRGQLGTCLGVALAEHEVLPVDLPEVDITSHDSIVGSVEGFGPEVVIHCAAATDVDGCERDPDLAYRVNALGTQNVALACRRVDAALVAVSTDYVFDGTKGEPYL